LAFDFSKVRVQSIIARVGQSQARVENVDGLLGDPEEIATAMSTKRLSTRMSI
jgi:hypothetical protein